MNAAAQPIEPTGGEVVSHPSIDVPTMLRTQSIRMDAMERRLERGDKRMGQIEAGLKEACETSSRVERNTGELVETFQSLKGGFKVLEWVGRLAKPLAAIFAALTAVLGTIAAVMHLGGGRGPGS